MQEKKLLLEAIYFLYLAKVVLLLFSFKHCMVYLREKEYPAHSIDEHILIQIKSAVARANLSAFWKNKCLVQSMAARWMLQTRKIPSHMAIGVIHDEKNKILAHAWISVEGFEIVNNSLNFKELYVLK